MYIESIDRQFNGKRKRLKEQTIIYKTLHRKLKQHYWHPSRCSCCLSGNKSLTRKIPDCDYDKRNIFVVICDTDILYRLTRSWWWP